MRDRSEKKRTIVAEFSVVFYNNQLFEPVFVLQKRSCINMRAELLKSDAMMQRKRALSGAH